MDSAQRSLEDDALLEKPSAREASPAPYEPFHRRLRMPKAMCVPIVGVVFAVLTVAWRLGRPEGRSKAEGCAGFLCSDTLPVSLAAVPPDSHLVIVDCGSSGTRFKVFKVLGGKVENTEMSDPVEMDALSSYVGRLDDLERDLKSAVNRSRQYVPGAAQADTPLFMYATAGMRKLGAEDQRAVFSQCHSSLKDGGYSPYAFGDARTLSGEMEAAFQYLSVNYDSATGQIAPVPTGQLEMGGASLQVAFKPSDTVLDNSWVYDLFGKREVIYAKSYMGYGQNLARLKTQESVVRTNKGRRLAGDGGIPYPCFLAGYSEKVVVFENTPEQQEVLLTGTGDFEGCRELTQEILHTEYECDLKPCPMHGDYMTKISGKFVGISGFKFSLLNLKLDLSTTTPKQLEEGVKEFCATNFGTLKGNTKFMRYECFLGTYAYTILHALGFSDDSQDLKFDGDYSWTLGAVIYEAFASGPQVQGGSKRRLLELPGIESEPIQNHKCYWDCRSQRRCAELQGSTASDCKQACSTRCST